MTKAMRPAERKPGRPRLPKNKGKRYSLHMRTTLELREKLEEAAWFSGRSLAQEVEYRLEKSFWEESVLRKLQVVPQTRDYHNTE